MSIKLLTANFCNCLADEQGQGIIEYVLIVSIVAIVTIGSLVSLRDVIYDVITSIPLPSA